MSVQQTVFLSERVTLAFLMGFVRDANSFSSYILVERESTKLNAKSLLSMSALKGYSGKIIILASGEDRKQALEALSDYCASVQRKTV